MAIRWDRLTVKAQEAMQRASELASEHGNPEVLPLHLLAALLEDREGIVPPLLARVGVQTATVQPTACSEIAASQTGGQRRHAGASFGRLRSCWTLPSRRPRISRTSMSPPNICCWAWPAEARSRAGAAGAQRRHAGQHPEGAGRGARQSDGDRPESRVEVPGAGALCARSDRAGAARQARSGDRARRRDSAHHPGALAPHQEQSGADRRARRGQDGHCRGAGAAHRLPATCPSSSRTSAWSRSIWARWWRARSIAASSKTV